MDPFIPYKAVRSKNAELWFYLAAGFALMLIIGWLVTPKILYSKKNQPFPFNHVTHNSAARLECETCHYLRTDGRFSGVPGFDECIKCHSFLDRKKKYSQAETAFLTEFTAPKWGLKKNAAWVKYGRQPDHVYFPHAPHIITGKLECLECHGELGYTQKPPPAYINRVSGYGKRIWDNMKMSDCMDCHIKKGRAENNACFVCHK